MKIYCSIRADSPDYIYEVKAFHLETDDQVGSILLGKLSTEFNGQYIRHAKVFSEANQNLGIGLQMYDYLLKHCKENRVTLFKMKNPTPQAQSIWKKLEAMGVTYIDRPDLQSTNHEQQIVLDHYQGLP